MTVCAMLSALGVVLLLIGSFVEVMDLSAAAIASLLCVFAVIEYSGASPWLIFAVTSVLSMILLPTKTPALMYLAFFGYYPIIKEKLERLPMVPSWALKEVIFHAAMGLLYLALKLFVPSVDLSFSLPVIAFVLLAEAVFILYDIAMSRLISFYLVRLRERFRKL